MRYLAAFFSHLFGLEVGCLLNNYHMSPLNTFFVSTHLHITQTLLLLPPQYLPKMETPIMLSAFHRSLPLHLAEALKESCLSHSNAF